MRLHCALEWLRTHSASPVSTIADGKFMPPIVAVTVNAGSSAPGSAVAWVDPGVGWAPPVAPQAAAIRATAASAAVRDGRSIETPSQWLGSAARTALVRRSAWIALQA